MRKFEGVSKSGLVFVCVGVIALVMLVMLSQGRALAVSPAPDCGPTREWNCVVPGCPDCPEILFEGTVCEKKAFEKATGRQCSPA